MSTSITIRLEGALREAVEFRAVATGRSIAEVVRDTLREALLGRPLAERIADLEGILELEPDDDPWRQQIKERNWRP